jgi:hypothetical protein
MSNAEATSIMGGDAGAGAAGPTAGIALATANAMHASAKVLLALFETGIVESGMKNLASRAVPSSLKYPHEGVAPGDHDSVGFLQQRASWGSVKSRMNVAESTRRFLTKAIAKEDRYDSAGRLAQSVQVSAFPDAYDRVRARAQAMLGLAQSGGGGLVGGFPPWPASAGSVHGHDSGVWHKIIALVGPTGLDRHSYGTLYNDRRTASGGWSWHASGHAVDFGGYNQDALANFFEARKPSVLELIHSTDKRNYGISRGHDHDMGGTLYAAHKNHVHVAMAGGGPVTPYDRGGLWPSGTVGVNTSGHTEHVTTGPSMDKQVRLLERLVELAEANPGAIGQAFMGTVPATRVAGRQRGRFRS